jgi:NAD(P)-dependent dehydrogenase (short-subunit alcohol dehydrogenase family)
MKRVWLITGAGSGLGAALARAVQERGDHAVATTRGGDGVRLDVTDDAAIAAAVADTLETHGRIDVLVNNAGYGLLGAFEECSDAELRDAFDTNLFGAMAVTRAVLPVMREQRAGHIVQMSSVVGVTSGPGGTGYVAPKAALEAWSEALAAEVAPLGIKVTIVEPGPFRTNFSGRSLRLAERSLDAYAPMIGPATTAFTAAHGTQPNDPYRGAQAIIAAVEVEDPPLRLPLGAEAFGWLGAYLKGRIDALAAAEPLGADTAYLG